MPRNPCAPVPASCSPQAGALLSPAPDPEVLRTVFDRSLSGMVLLRRGPAGVEAATVNPAAACRLGGTVEDLTGTGWADGLDPGGPGPAAGRRPRRCWPARTSAGRRRSPCRTVAGPCSASAPCSTAPGSRWCWPSSSTGPSTDTVSWVGHELRTPITSVLGYTELLREGVGGHLSHHQTELLDRVQGNARRLLDLVEDLVTPGPGRLP